MKNELSRLVYYHDLKQDPILRTFADVAEAVSRLKLSEGNPVSSEVSGGGVPTGMSHIPGDINRDLLVDRVYGAVRMLLDRATSYGFDKNLWRDYLTFLLLTNENPFSLTAEKQGIEGGSVQIFARQDMEVFCRLFVYDFSGLEKALNVDCFSVITNYTAVPKRAQNYNRNVSLRVREVSDAISAVLDTPAGDVRADVAAGNTNVDVAAGDAHADVPARDTRADIPTRDAHADRVLEIISEFYRKYGVGMFGLNRAFRLKEQEAPAMTGGSPVPGGHEGFRGVAGPFGLHGTAADTFPGKKASGIAFEPINNIDDVRLSDLVGYEIQKQKLRENTEAFLRGYRANNCLLYGDAGTGKSTSIKALIAEYYDQGLRMIELYKHQMQSLSEVISTVKHRNYKFIIYMDDLSFEDHETEYKYLKAVIEGGLENRPDNVLIYATSNRRNLIKETWNDTADVDLEKHRGDTLQEKLSLVDRFGIKIPYMKPNKKEFSQIVEALAQRVPGWKMDMDELMKEAAKWEVAHGGMSGRTARQFIDYMAGRTL